MNFISFNIDSIIKASGIGLFISTIILILFMVVASKLEEQ